MSAILLWWCVWCGESCDEKNCELSPNDEHLPAINVRALHTVKGYA